jgi:lambda repressor-like predicted transcriptional regulator
MTDRTGGSSSPNYVHRERPENFEEEDEAASDAECVTVLRDRSGWSMDDEDARLAVKDPQLAKALRTRSESVEKVVASMLHQPPEVRPLHPDDVAHSPGSPEPKKRTSAGTNSHPHTLPNGVRLRAALATLINDFFARESSPPSMQALNTYLPPGIVPLLPISSLISEIPSSISVSPCGDIMV